MFQYTHETAIVMCIQSLLISVELVVPLMAAKFSASFKIHLTALLEHLRDCSIRVS